MKAPRDLTSRQFADALKRIGFRHHFLFWFKDVTGAVPDVSFGGLFRRNGKLLRRATIAHLKRCRDQEIEKHVLGKPSAVCVPPKLQGAA